MASGGMMVYKNKLAQRDAGQHIRGLLIELAALLSGLLGLFTVVVNPDLLTFLVVVQITPPFEIVHEKSALWGAICWDRNGPASGGGHGAWVKPSL